MSYLLALDQGTTSSRALLFDTDTRVVALAQREFRQHYPRPGWVEHDAGEIRDTQLDVAREAIRTAGIEPEQIAAIGITNQRETTVLWDRRSGEPVAPAIVWQDRRTARTCDRLRQEGHAERITELTGLQLDPYFSGTKLRWLLRSDPELRRRAERGELAFGTIDSWLVWCLTGGRTHVTDASNASRTLLFNLREGRWDEELLELFEIPAAVLPEVVDSSGVCGTTAPEVLGAALPIAGIAGDQQSALFGQMCVRPGMVKNTYGTGCFLLMTTGAQPTTSEHRLLSTVAWRIGGKTTYALEGSVFIGGAVVQWLRDELGMIATADEVEALAATVPDTGGVVCVPAFTGLGAPHWDPYARGALLGMTRGTSRAHVARAALESIAHQVADVVEAMRADAEVDLQEIRVDGGAAANDLLLGIQADLLGAAVIRPTQLETTALGAAYLAGLGAGVWPDVEGLEGRWQHERRFEPSLPGPQLKLQRARWRRALERAADWARDEDGVEDGTEDGTADGTAEEPPVEP